MSQAAPSRSAAAGPASGLNPWPILASLIVLAIGLRFYRLGYWNFEATEMFTLRDSVRPAWHNARPLGYLLNYYLVRPLRPLDEFGLRVVPALVAVLAIPVSYAVARHLVGVRAALFGSLLLTLSPLHVFYAQFARYWSLVFLFSAVYPYALYIGVRERRRGWFVLGVVTLVLAVLAHPVTAIAIGGPALWVAYTYLRPQYLKQAWSHRGFRWAIGVAAVLGMALAIRLVPILHDWITMHDKNPEMGQFLLPPKRPHGLKQLVLLLTYLESLTLPISLAAATGVYVLWRERDRPLAIFVAALAVFHLAFIALISVRTPVSTFYLLPAAPAFYLGAGVFLDRVSQAEWSLRPRWLVPATIALVLLAAGLPTLVSQYLNGRRFDFREAARWIQSQRAPGDIVFSDQPMVLAHYLGGAEVRKLRQDTTPLTALLGDLGRTGRGGTLWVVAPAPAHAFRTNLKAGGLARWLYDHCQLSNTIGRGRVDFRQQYLQVFRCRPMAGQATHGSASSGAAAGS